MRTPLFFRLCSAKLLCWAAGGLHPALEQLCCIAAPAFTPLPASLLPLQQTHNAALTPTC